MGQYEILTIRKTKRLLSIGTYIPESENGPPALGVAVPLKPVEVLCAGRRLPHLAARPRSVAALLPPRHGADVHGVVRVRFQEVEPRPQRLRGRFLAGRVLCLYLGAEGVFPDAAIRVEKVRRALKLNVVELDLAVPFRGRLPLDLDCCRCESCLENVAYVIRYATISATILFDHTLL